MPAPEMIPDDVEKRIRELAKEIGSQNWCGCESCVCEIDAHLRDVYEIGFDVGRSTHDTFQK
jgi:hypothetical protein